MSSNRIGPSPVRLDRAVSGLLRSESRPTERKHLQRFVSVSAIRQSHLDEVFPTEGLSEAITNDCMPVINDRNILRSSVFVETLSDVFRQIKDQAGEGDPVAMLGAVAIKREIENHALLRRQTDSLIER